MRPVCALLNRAGLGPAMGSAMTNKDPDASLMRRALFTCIAASTSDVDTHRAERLLLRGLARQWPEQRICQLLAALQRSLSPSTQETAR